MSIKGKHQNFSPDTTSIVNFLETVGISPNCTGYRECIKLFEFMLSDKYGNDEMQENVIKVAAVMGLELELQGYGNPQNKLLYYSEIIVKSIRKALSVIANNLEFQKRAEKYAPWVELKKEPYMYKTVTLISLREIEEWGMTEEERKRREFSINVLKEYGFLPSCYGYKKLLLYIELLCSIDKEELELTPEEIICNHIGEGYYFEMKSSIVSLIKKSYVRINPKNLLQDLKEKCSKYDL